MALPMLAPDAKDALRRAREVAEARGMRRADAADILVGLLESRDATRLLALFSTDPERIRTALAFLTLGTARPPDEDAEERTVDLARAEAERLEATEAGSDHLMLGLARQSGSAVASILESVGMTLGAGRDAVRYLHGLLSDWEPPAVRPPAAEASTPLASMTLPMDPDDAAQTGRAAMADFEVGVSRLIRVIGIGLVVEASEVLVEMIALEIREAGAVLLWRAQTETERLLGAADLTIADDLGTAYDVFPASWSSGGRESRGETRFTPAPLRDARTLIVEVRSFGRIEWMPTPSPLGLASDEVVGSWRFEVPLGS
jgi:Clp amino terminal domain, pathogenicity island component